MSNIDNKSIPELTNLISITKVFLHTWKWWLIGALISFELASVLMSGWPKGIIPSLTYPYKYSGDGLSHSWMAQRAIEGWIFENPRSGYPFGSNFMDYPGSDSGNLLILKLLGLITTDYHSALNLFFLLSFPAIFVASFCTLNSLGLNKILSFSASLLFVFQSFHFIRIEHMFYLWYFVIPFFYYLGFRIFFATHLDSKFPKNIWTIILILLGFIGLASFGVYYAIFGIIVLSTATLGSWARNKTIKAMYPGLIAIVFIIVGVMVNIGPNILNKKINGPNPEVAIRNCAEAEIYGFKFMQLIMPRNAHRIKKLASISHEYYSTSPLVNENYTASIGLVGSVGFFILSLFLIAKISGTDVDERMSFLSLLIFILFMFGTIGGLGSLFSSTISSSIRGWNRISIFIAFGSIAGTFLFIQLLINRYFYKNQKSISTIFALVLCVFGLYDQTTKADVSLNLQTKKAFLQDRKFVQQIESSLPKGSAIYQLPYLKFPEGEPVNRVQIYDLVSGFIHSKNLKWSFGGMKGREGDFFYRALSIEPMERQLEVIKELGFGGIYIDRRGYTDSANSLIEKLTLLLKTPPTITREDGEVVFFKIDPAQNVDLTNLTSIQIIKKFYPIFDKFGARYPASYSEGIDFTRPNWPEFLRSIVGLSWLESWGRWSDLNISPSIKITFFNPLPNKFTLILKAQPYYGPGTTQEFLFRINNQDYKYRMPYGVTEYRTNVDLKNKPTDYFEFIPLNPISPHQISNDSSDIRKLGIGFIGLRIEE
jgi:phosphoglycerol transferase